MDYNFKGANRVNVYMDSSNTEIIYKCYFGDEILKEGVIGSNLRPIEIYNFLDAISSSDASLAVGDGENNLEEVVDYLEVLSRESIFFQN